MIKRNRFLGPVLLGAILLMAVFLFVFKLDKVPSGLYVDEATVGYNAYSILKTGKDEYGKSFPILFRLFGSYTPPLFVYGLIPFVWALGLNVLAIRLLSVLSGLVITLIVFLFLKSLKKTSPWLPYLGGLLFAISPWTIFYARLGYEVTFAFAIFIIGAYCIWLGLEKSEYLKRGLFILSLSAYGAHTQRYLAPLFILTILIVFRKKLFRQKFRKQLLIGLFLAFIIQIPQLLLINTPAFWNKGNLFYSGQVINRAQNTLGFLPYFLAFPIAFLRELFSQWITYFSPRSLFFLPDPDLQRSLPAMSVFYDWMVVPYLLGLYLLWQARRKDWVKYLFILAVLSPLPTALVSDPFSTQRALPLLFPLIITITLGVNKLLLSLKKNWQRIFVLGLLVAYSLIFFWRSYFILFRKERAVVWGYGFEQLAEIIKKNPETNFVIDQVRMKPVYIELAFYQKFSPAELQKTVDQEVSKNYYWQTTFDPEYNFANIETRSISWGDDVYKKQILVGDEFSISQAQADEHFLEEAFEIKDVLGNLIFRGYSTNPDLKRGIAR